jgi:hypothetical protein
MNMPDLRPTDRRPRGLAGGSLLAISIIAGVVIGTVNRQPSIGFLGGLGTGIALLILVWLLARR